jgi:uncharacterized SAM-binding protein YcdF (DUF218 family)
VLAFLFSITGALFACAAAALWVCGRPHSRAARRCLCAVIAIYAIVSTYAVPAAVSRVMTANYHQFSTADGPRGSTALAVLGSGSKRVEGWTENLDVMSSAEAARVLEAWRVFRLIDPAIVISSGGLPYADAPFAASGDHMRLELIRLGVPDARIIVDTASRDTHDEAVRIAALMRLRSVEHLVLVTSDTHMRRALGVFRAQGWNAVPAIAPTANRPEYPVEWFIPSPRGLALNEEVTHELLGLSYYWLRGWWRS